MSALQRQHPQAGFTLVELMIALVLGLLITQAVISIFLSSSRSYRTSEGVAEMQEQGRMAALLTSPIIRQAGYLPDPVRVQTSPAEIFKVSLDKQAIRGFDNSSPALYTGVSSSTVRSGTDVLAIAFMGRGSVGDTPLKTCLGDAVSDTELAVNVFYVTVSDSTGVSSLACYTNRGAPGDALSAGTVRNEQIISGISDMQVQYGIDTDGDRVPNRYVVASAVTDWTQVLSIKVNFTSDSVSKAAAGTADSAGVKGGRIRRDFSTTLQVRNRLTG